MSKASKYLGIDFGAESGRALLGVIQDGKLGLEEIHRFPNTPVRTLGHIHWDILRLFGEVKQGLKLALAATSREIDGVGVDTWGVDFGLLGEDGELLGNPFHYRDDRTVGLIEEVSDLVGRDYVYETTGIQFMPFNTLYQLYSMARTGATALKSASTILLMPDLFNYWLTGVKVCEFSEATTSQCYDPRRKDWAREMLAKLGIPTGIFPEIVPPGTPIGPLAQDLANELGAGKGIPVIAPATHDTGSAVAAVPATGEDHAYLSSGTWSLMGVELPEPLINARALAGNYTNEGGVGGRIRFLRNIMGLWIVQECRRTWLGAGEEHSYAELADMAAECQGFVSVIDPDNLVFYAPGDMPQRIREFCRDRGQPVPTTKGEVVRCVLDSLALRYRATVEGLEDLLGRKLAKIHIVGGGTQNTLLSQLTADATGKTVIAGPVEATAVGNVLVQAMGAGLVSSLAEAREIVRNSFELVTYEPRESAAAEKAYRLFGDVSGR